MKTTGLINSLLVSGLLMCMNAMNAAPALPHNGGKTTHESEKDSAYCLRLSGKLYKAGRNTESSTVVLLHNNTPVDSMTVQSGNDFEFMLEKNTWYSVRISRPGAVSKLISICTAVPKTNRTYLYELEFTVDELISDEEAQYLDKETLDFPMAIFMYDYKVKRFNYVAEYTSNIRKHLAAPIAGTDDVNSLSTARTLPKK